MRVNKNRRAQRDQDWWFGLLPPRARKIRRPEVAVTGFIGCFFIVFYLINVTYDFETQVREYLGYLRFVGAIVVTLLVYIKLDRFPLWLGYLGALIELGAFVVHVGFLSDYEQILFRLQEFPLITLYLAWLFPPVLVRLTIYPVLAGTLCVAYFLGDATGMAEQSGMLNVVSLVLLTGAASMIGGYVKTRFRYQAEVDELTGAYNRRGLALRGEAELVSGLRYGRPVSVALLDMDNFKSINDQGGHGAGDQALKDLVQHLELGSRQRDLIARLGGDEFVLVFRNTTRTQARVLMERLQEKSPFPWSFGVSQARREDNLSTLILRADRDMYISKRDRSLGLEKRAGGQD